MELRIAELLAERGISQSQMARDLGVKQPTVSRWVTGESSPPTKKLAAIADYLDVDPIMLFRDYAKRPHIIRLFLSLQNLDDHEILAVSALVDSLGRRDHSSASE